MLLFRSLALAFAGALAGCAVTLNLPANRFESPEVQGGSSLFLDLGLQGSNKVVLVPITTATPPVTDAPVIQRSGSSLMLGGGFGISSRLDVGARFIASAPALLRVKYQLLGSGRMAARPHSFSLAVSGAVGTSQRSDRDQDAFSSTRATTKTDFLTFDGSVIEGYRFSPAVLLYGSVFHTHTSVDGTISQTPSSFAASFQGEARQTGGALGLEMKSDHVGVMLEMGYGSARYKRARDDAPFLGLAIRLYSGRIR